MTRRRVVVLAAAVLASVPAVTATAAPAPAPAPSVSSVAADADWACIALPLLRHGICIR